jgi:lipoprotein-anchoring transpeptidase ErfK/SrfK
MALSLVLVLGLSGCQKAPGESRVSATPGASATASTAQESLLTFTPARGARQVRPDAQVVVATDTGSLTSVTVRSAVGAVIPGDLDASAGVWRSSGALAAGTDYTIRAVSSTEDGRSKTETSSFTTLKPTATVGAVLIPGDDWTVGVGMPVMVNFSRSVKNKDAALKALTVKTTPAVEGAWHWMNDRAVWWRPKEFWPSGAKVRVTAALGGVELAKGTWGRRSYTSQFTVGSAVISTVDVKAHKLTVTRGGKVVKVIPVTTGLDTPKYRTRGGIKVIMDKKPVENMDAASTGTAEDDPEYYNLNVKWAMRITWSGEYLHAAPWSVSSQGRANVSHGCTGMSTGNAKWLFDFSKIGDVVVYKNSTRPLEFGNGYTAWELSWERWSGGKARPDRHGSGPSGQA